MKTALAGGCALLVGATFLSGCSSDDPENASPDADTTTSEPVAADPSMSPDGKQACEYWSVAKEQTIESIGVYILAATKSAEVAAKSDDQWLVFVRDLETIYPLATGAEPADTSVLLTTSAAVDNFCDGYESWPGEVTAELPSSDSSNPAGSSEANAPESDAEDLSTITPISPDDLAVAFPTRKQLSKVAGRPFKPTKAYSQDWIGNTLKGAVIDEPLTYRDAELSDPACAPLGVYQPDKDATTGEVWVGNKWVERLQTTAWATVNVMDEDLVDAPLSGWYQNVFSAPADLVTETLANAKQATPTCGSATANVKQPAILGGGAKKKDLLQSEPFFTSGDHTVICDVFVSDFSSTSLSIYEPIGATLHKIMVRLNGDPKPGSDLVTERLPALVNLYNKLSGELAAAQSISRTDLLATDVISACGGSSESSNSDFDAEEAKKYSAAPVVYVVETSDGGDVTLETPTGTSQRVVGEDETFLPQPGFEPGDFLYVSVQNDSDAGLVTCEIYVNGERVSRNTSDAAFGIATCEATANLS